MKHFLPLLILLLSACSQNIGNLSIVSTQPTNISNEYDSIGQIQGESKINTNTRHPRVNMTMINEAIQNALDISGADLITDATFERNYTFMFFFEANYLVVTGEGWVKKKEGIKREKEIIEYDPDTGEPIMPQVYSAKGLSPVEKKVFLVYAGTCVGIIWLTYYIFFEHSMM